MSFVFKMQSILDIKRKELEAAEAEELAIRQEISVIEKRITAIRDAYFADRDELNEHIRNSLFEKMKIFESSLEDKKERILALLSLLNARRHELADCAARTLLLRKKTTSLEKMKERKSKEYDIVTEKKLQQEIDGRSALAVWRRQQSGENG